MARSRNIKPAFFTNDMLVELPFEVRLLFIGLWTIADKAGRLHDRPKKIKMEIFPADNVDCEAALVLLAERGFICRYPVGKDRYIQIMNWGKHQNPHIKEADSVIPEMPEVAPEIPGIEQEIPARATLIPDSLNLIPDSPIPSGATRLSGPPSECQPGEEDVNPAKQKTPIAATSTTRARVAKPVPETSESWTAYSTAYFSRYGVQPVRNAKANSQLSQLVKRLGARESPMVAEFYVRHNSTLYVRSKHAVDLLVRDCEGLRTELFSGRMVTDTQARQTDRKQNNLGIAERLISEQRQKEAASGK